MGLEKHNGKPYYYRKLWVNGTCQSRYAGAGDFAEAMAELDHLARLRQEQARAERLEQDRIDAQIRQVGRSIRDLTRVALIATGHRPHRGQWRKQRMSKHKDAVERVARLQAGQGSADDLAQFESDLQRIPALVEVFDLCTNAAAYIIKTVSGKDQALSSAMAIKMSQMKAGLGYESASQLERLLIEQVCLCWLRHAQTENYYNANVLGGKPSYESARYWDHVLSTSQARFLRAAETLARVRRLASRTPEILQVNIAKNQQVNLGELT